MKPKLKILCLHGFRQNSTSFQHRTAQLQRHVADIAELHYIDAPHLLPLYYKPQPDTPPPQSIPTPKHAWLITRDQTLGDPSNPQWHVAPAGLDTQQHTRQTQGWRACWELLCDNHVCEEYDGILGFSQGAAIAAVVAGMVAHIHGNTPAPVGDAPDVPTPPPTTTRLRFVILCSGYMPAAPDALHVLQRAAPIRMPSLHVFGGTGGGDRQVMTEASRMLCACFAGDVREVVEHTQGHLVPREALDVLRAFLLKQRA